MCWGAFCSSIVFRAKVANVNTSCFFLCGSTVGLLTSAAVVSSPSDDVLCPDGDHTPVPTTGETEPHHIPTVSTEPDELTEPVEPSDPMKVAASSLLPVTVL